MDNNLCENNVSEIPSEKKSSVPIAGDDPRSSQSTVFIVSVSSKAKYFRVKTVDGEVWWIIRSRRGTHSKKDARLFLCVVLSSEK